MVSRYTIAFAAFAMCILAVIVGHDAAADCDAARNGGLMGYVIGLGIPVLAGVGSGTGVGVLRHKRGVLLPLAVAIAVGGATWFGMLLVWVGACTA
jgi:hypothetical protein